MARQTVQGDEAGGPPGPPWRRPGVVVAALTGATLLVVALLALTAAQSAPTPAAPADSASTAIPASPSAAGGTASRAAAGGPQTTAATAATAEAPPAGSGTGRRVVYSVSRHRVWAITADGAVARQFTVDAGSASPAPGAYSVYSRSLSGRGGDGASIRYVVRFAHSQPGGVVVGFDTVTPPTPTPGATGPQPSPPAAAGGVAGGAIRESPQDAAFLWDFAPLRSPVIVLA